MKNYTFAWEITTLVEQFIGAFNDIVIRRYDKDKNLIPSLSSIKVNYVYGPKGRVFNTLNKPAPGGLTLPAVSVSISKISRNNSRVMNKNSGHDIPYNDTDNPLSYVKKIPQPIPIDIGINMSIWTKYQLDMEQILANFMPYCDPYVIISWKMPQLHKDYGVELRSEVLWSGDINLTYPIDIQSNQSFRIIADTSFTIKGWMFKKMEENVNKIYIINSDYTETNFNDNLLQSVDDISTEYFTISARPDLGKAGLYPYQFIVTDQTFLSSLDVSLYGKSFLNIRNLYLSASDESMFDGITFFNPFSSYPSHISNDYPGFRGIVVPSFTVDSEKVIEFNFPQVPKTSGFLDVIVENEAGYGKLTIDSRTPFISSYDGAIDIQSPWVNGIIIDYRQ